MREHEVSSLIDQLLACSSAVRYVALYQQGRVFSRQRDPLRLSSAAESDRYEELLVNPALLKLATQRGNIDCGGLRFLIVAYGSFYQLVTAFGDGHISVCIELTADPIEHEAMIRSILTQHGS